jgi:hypothetical protein
MGFSTADLCDRHEAMLAMAVWPSRFALRPLSCG